MRCPLPTPPAAVAHSAPSPRRARGVVQSAVLAAAFLLTGMAATGCVSTGSVNASYGTRGIEAPRLSGPTAALSRPENAAEIGTLRLATASD
jgi:hypothetical protein